MRISCIGFLEINWYFTFKRIRIENYTLDLLARDNWDPDGFKRVSPRRPEEKPTRHRQEQRCSRRTWLSRGGSWQRPPSSSHPTPSSHQVSALHLSALPTPSAFTHVIYPSRSTWNPTSLGCLLSALHTAMIYNSCHALCMWLSYFLRQVESMIKTYLKLLKINLLKKKGKQNKAWVEIFIQNLY